MPKYVPDMIAGYYLYFTAKCVVEAMHVHASDADLNPSTAAKLFVYDNGDTLVQHAGCVNDRDMAKIRAYIKNNHKQMYKKWQKYSDNGYYKKRTN